MDECLSEKKENDFQKKESNIKERLTILAKRFKLELDKKIVAEDNVQLEDAIGLISLMQSESSIKVSNSEDKKEKKGNNFFQCCSEPDRVTLVRK